jgi:poly-gamma-glutamate synthesis protein (capsule biosynthesis protein)
MTMHRNSFGLGWLWLCSAVIAAGITCALGQNPPNNNQQPAKAPATTQTPAPACNVADGFTLAAVGDLIFSEPLSGLQDGPFQALLGRLRSADATFGNLENTLIDLQSFAGYPQAENGGGHARGSPAVATDWGIEGMRATDRAADEAGLVHAGTGEDRTAARAAHYLQTAKGRVALVSMTSSATPLSVPADAVGGAPGRPGLSALRITPYVIVSPEMMKSLHKIHDALPPAALQAEEQEKRVLQPESQGKHEGKPEELKLFGAKYRVGDKAVHFSYEMNDGDLREILKGIRDGKQNSDFLIATIHAHEPDNWSDEPADFLPKLAHAAIDAGADVFIGHGPHQLRAIEIYQGKPIFYSLANFFFQLNAQEPLPAEVYEDMRVDPHTATDNELMAKLLKAWFDSPIWYQSVIAVSRFEHGRVAEVRLYPVDLGFTAKGFSMGIPRPASPAVAQTILEQLQRLSKPYGTTIAIEDGVGVIRLQK